MSPKVKNLHRDVNKRWRSTSSKGEAIYRSRSILPTSNKDNHRNKRGFTFSSACTTNLYTNVFLACFCTFKSNCRLGGLIKTLRLRNSTAHEQAMTSQGGSESGTATNSGIHIFFITINVHKWTPDTGPQHLRKIREHSLALKMWWLDQECPWRNTHA